MNQPGAVRGPILLTNHGLAQRAGTELFTRDLAIGLRERGWQPVVYSPVPGEVADDIRRAGIRVVDDLAAVIETPVLVHGQHHLPAMTAMLRFPHVPAVFVCHGWLPAEERPPVFPSIRRYVAVDDLCFERVAATPGVATADIRTIYNAVSLERFRPRPPLPARPARALIFSNYATGENFAPVLREACRRSGITHVDVAGAGSGAPVDAPEAVLPQYDIVFAKARCAIEALAVGAAVIVVDAHGLAGLVTRENVAAWRRLNFGFRTLRPERLRPEEVCAEIARYDPQDASEVSRWMRAEAGASRALDAWEAVYAEVLNAPPATLPETSGCAAASVYLGQLAMEFQERAVQLADANHRLQDASARARAAEQAAAHLRRTLTGVEASRIWRTFAPYRRLRRWMAGPPDPAD